MQKKLPCYLRTYRRRAGLSQKQLANLLGLGHQTSVSKLERRLRAPNLRVAFGCQAIFGVPAHRIFPAQWSDVAALVAERAHRHDLAETLTADGLHPTPLAETLYENNPT